MTARKLDEIRSNVLEQMDRDARVKRVAILGAATLELVMLVCVLLVIDWSNDTHLLVLMLSVLGYTVVVLGLVALGAHTSRAIGQLAGALRMEKSAE